ncbi:LysM peptidoglycan-binding domain-containing protein [Streptococcus cuniculipharyngis]|uniref:LysM peptidoglycan-binding domain-containing protein n=1 Tax=Streptococcus cuniculipharyngis TaxID=1562651 RepID=A0A5C5SC94_9STRE|nr:LysM peptidoglycan-binding domain-containing protein [Streptococcus cuniculipharyngis]TWS98717.1 LysM peptidoglycan-binding domain-containing protein [Streptococcus cuniculipharyngis]
MVSNQLQRLRAQATARALSSSQIIPQFSGNLAVKPQPKVLVRGAHQVLVGESVWSISRRYGISMQQLVAWNNISNNTIHAGQILQVVPPLLVRGTSSHTVQAGESVWSISRHYGISMEQLITWNGIRNNTVHPGERLQVTAPAIHTVQRGDTLWSISRRYGLTVEQLVAWNGIKGNLIRPNQSLRLSPIVGLTINSATLVPSHYTVRQGDSLWRIANKYGMSLTDLRQRTGVVGDLIYPGQVLNLTISNPVNKSGERVHAVQRGDSLWGIANQYGVTIAELVTWNGLSNKSIYPNQKLIVGAIAVSPPVKNVETFPTPGKQPSITIHPPSVSSGIGITPGPAQVKPSQGITVQPPKSQGRPDIESFPLPNEEMLILANNIILDGSHFDSQGNLRPNINYRSGEHDYYYETDALGRIIGVGVGELQLKTHAGRLTHNPNTTGKIVTDHAGHLIADLFGGSPKLDNLVSQDKFVNMREYRELERLWHNAIKAGKKVEVSIRLSYDGLSKRPQKFDIKYRIDSGKVISKIIGNN